MSYATFLRQRRRNDIISRTPNTEDLGYYPYIAGTALNPALNAKVSPGVNRKTNTDRLREDGYRPYITGTSPEPRAANVPVTPEPVTPEPVTPEPVTPEEVAPELTDAEQLAAWGATRGYTPATVTAPKYEAATTPAMSYAEYLKRTGMAGVSQKQYDATVRSAEADYAKGKATYGQKAETLGQRGLTGSGYGDYLTGASFAAMQNAKVAAADTKALTDAEMARGYGEYLTGVQQANAQAEVQAANANEEARVEAENANAQAAAEAEAYNKQQFETERTDVQNIIADGVANGLTDEEIMFRIQTKYGNAFDGSLASWLNKGRTALKGDTETVDTENQNRANLAVTQYLTPDENGNRASVEDIRKVMLVDGYTEEQINAAMAQYSKDFLAQQMTNINLKGITLNDIPTNDQIDNEVTLGRLTEADAATLKAEAMNKRNELLVDKFENEVDTPEEETAFFAQIDEMRANNEISTKTYKGLYKQRLKANLEGILEESNDKLTVSSVASLAAYIGTISNNVSGGLSSYLMGELINMTDIKDVKYEVEYIGKDMKEYDYITLKLGEKTQKIEVDAFSADNRVDKDISEKLGSGTKGDIKALEGEIYAYDGRSWRRLELKTSSVGNKNNKIGFENILLYMFH